MNRLALTFALASLLASSAFADQPSKKPAPTVKPKVIQPGTSVVTKKGTDYSDLIAKKRAARARRGATYKAEQEAMAKAIIKRQREFVAKNVEALELMQRLRSYDLRPRPPGGSFSPRGAQGLGAR